MLTALNAIGSPLLLDAYVALRPAGRTTIAIAILLAALPIVCTVAALIERAG